MLFIFFSCGARRVTLTDARRHRDRMQLESTETTVQAYCDSSGKTGTDSPFLTLASYFASRRSWRELEERWTTTLESFKAPYFHARETITRIKAFKGWSPRDVRQFVTQLFNILGQLDRGDFFAVSSTVDLNEYQKAKMQIPGLRSPEAICLDHCMGMVFRHPKRDYGIELLFDRDEDFAGRMLGLWNIRKPHRIWWAQKVTRILTVDMKTSPAIQSADLLAWFSNRYRTKGENDHWGGLYWATSLLTPHYHMFFDAPIICSVYDAKGNMKPGVQLDPPRIKMPGPPTND